MHLQSIRVRNFRRLKNARIDLDKQTSIFVGSNNSGKTTATYVLEKFLGTNSKGFSIHDFSSDCWKLFNQQTKLKEGESSEFPMISLDLWLEVKAEDLHRVIDLLPSLDWKDVPVGVRIEYRPKNPQMLLDNFIQANTKIKDKAKGEYHPWPKSITDYLSKNLKAEYEIKYFVLDRNKFDDDLNAKPEYKPLQLGNDTDRSGAKIMRSLIKVDLLYAQRYLDDHNATGRAEDLSKRMNRFYDRNLEQKEDDFDAMQALAASENELTKHLQTVFNPTLESLNNLGYPGFSNPKLEIRASLNHESIAGQTRLHYTIGGGDDLLSLPDRYNGLGFKNLIYMVIEVLDFHSHWKEDEDNRPPLHLIIIEEPEAHLHAQLQQVFIKKLWEIIHPAGSLPDSFNTQMIVTTHSPHIIYESGFQPIRYFRRNADDAGIQSTEVLNLTIFYDKTPQQTRDFLQRYMKLTHCDLFFADAAIMVEGNVERLLLPLMINKSAPKLNSTYLSILEVGGAFAHLFKDLIEFLGLTTLIITDLDSVRPKLKKEEKTQDTAGKTTVEIIDESIDSQGVVAKSDASLIIDVAVGESNGQSPNDAQEEEEDEDSFGDDTTKVNANETKDGSACIADFTGAVTSNQTLIKWLPKLSEVEALLNATEEDKTQIKSDTCKSHVHVCYQSKIALEWGGEKGDYAGRTLEEAFALQNLVWTQDISRRDIGLRVVTKKDNRKLQDLRERLFKKVSGSSFKKTDFALGLLLTPPEQWAVPSYIENGLKWLEKTIGFPEKEVIEVVQLAVAADEIIMEIETPKTDEQENK